MIETREQRAEPERHEEKTRQARAQRYEDMVGRGQNPPPSYVAQPPKDHEIVAQPSVTQPRRKRAEYFRDYRKRPKTCPHCGKEL